MKRTFIILVGLFISVIGLFILNLFVGSVDVPLADVWKVLVGGEASQSSWTYIVMQARVPQSVTAVLAGASLAMAGLMLQTLFVNPLAGPSVLGIDAGASLGVAVVVLLTGSSALQVFSVSGYAWVLVGAFIGALGVLALIILFSMWVKNAVMLLIMGLMMSYVTSSAISLLNFFSTPENVFSYTIWGMGDFSGVTVMRLPIFVGLLVPTLAFSLLLMKPMNALLLGERYAANLGVHVGQLRVEVLILTGLLVATVTAFCGPISFIGLTIPHVARMCCKTADHRVLIPATLLCGAALALLCNWCSTLPSGGIIPLNVITPVFGAPIIIYVIVRSRKLFYYR